MAFEMIERLFAIVTLVKRFAGSGAEPADQPGIRGMAPGTGNRGFRIVLVAVRRRNAVGF